MWILASCLPHTAHLLAVHSVTSNGILHSLEIVKVYILRPTINHTTSLWTGLVLVSTHRRDLCFFFYLSFFFSLSLFLSHPTPALHNFPFASFFFCSQQSPNFIHSFIQMNKYTHSVLSPGDKVMNQTLTVMSLWSLVFRRANWQVNKQLYSKTAQKKKKKRGGTQVYKEHTCIRSTHTWDVREGFSEKMSVLGLKIVFSYYAWWYFLVLQKCFLLIINSCV